MLPRRHAREHKDPEGLIMEDTDPRKAVQESMDRRDQGESS